MSNLTLVHLLLIFYKSTTFSQYQFHCISISKLHEGDYSPLYPIKLQKEKMLKIFLEEFSYNLQQTEIKSAL